MIIFTCSENLELLCNSIHVFGDGTFDFSPRHFEQVYTINVYKQNYYVPVAFCILASKTEDQYMLMWRELLNICQQLLNKVRTFTQTLKKLPTMHDWQCSLNAH